MPKSEYIALNVIVGSSVREELADKTAEAVDTGRIEITDLFCIQVLRI
ncbi:hypothetical protein [Nitrosomonas ureae]|nr:hypothetical protein [Nitrosomonas ureae]